MKRIIFPLSVIIILTSSCVSFHHGNISSGPLVSPDYSLQQTAIGYAKTNRVFGFGGYSKNGLIRRAKENLYQTTHLKEGEYFSNLTVDFKETFIFFLVHRTEVFVTADILKDKGKGPKTFKSSETNIEAPVALGDSVYFDIDYSWETYLKGKVISIKEYQNSNLQEVLIIYRDKKDRIKTKKTFKFFKKKPDFQTSK